MRLKLEGMLHEKSMVVSPSPNTWDIVDEKEEVYDCFEKVCCYKYLGIETHGSMSKTSTAKQIKIVKAARRYRGACRYLSRRGPDVVDVSVCSWRNVAIPALLFGVETVVFTKETIGLKHFIWNFNFYYLLTKV